MSILAISLLLMIVAEAIRERNKNKRWNIYLNQNKGWVILILNTILLLVFIAIDQQIDVFDEIPLISMIIGLGLIIKNKVNLK